SILASSTSSASAKSVMNRETSLVISSTMMRISKKMPSSCSIQENFTNSSLLRLSIFAFSSLSSQMKVNTSPREFTLSAYHSDSPEGVEIYWYNSWGEACMTNSISNFTLSFISNVLNILFQQFVSVGKIKK